MGSVVLAANSSAKASLFALARACKRPLPHLAKESSSRSFQLNRSSFGCPLFGDVRVWPDSTAFHSTVLRAKTVLICDLFEPSLRALSLKTIPGFSQLGAATLQNRYAPLLL